MGAIVRSEDQEIFLEMDRRDQQQIVAAATGAVIDDLIYKVKGKLGISWAGINHICFFMGDIEVNEPKETQWERITMFGDRVYWSATVKARNLKYTLSSLGTAEAPELMEIHILDDNKDWAKNEDGSWKMCFSPDEHCRRKALSMAQRNAKRAVIPEAVLKEWLKYFVDLKEGKPVEPPFQRKYVESDVTTAGKKPSGKPPKTEKKEDSDEVKRIKELAKRDREKLKPKPITETEKTDIPNSVDEVIERISTHIIGYEDWLVVSDRGQHFRVGKIKRLEEEMEYTVDELVRQMGGEWSTEDNCWKVPKRG